MKKLLEKIEFLIDLCQKINGLLKAAPDDFKSLAAPPIEYLTVQEVAGKCFVSTRTAWRWMDEQTIIPAGYFGRSPMFAVEYIEESIRSGKLRTRRRRK